MRNDGLMMKGGGMQTATSKKRSREFLRQSYPYMTHFIPMLFEPRAARNFPLVVVGTGGPPRSQRWPNKRDWSVPHYSENFLLITAGAVIGRLTSEFVYWPAKFSVMTISNRCKNPQSLITSRYIPLIHAHRCTTKDTYHQSRVYIPRMHAHQRKISDTYIIKVYRLMHSQRRTLMHNQWHLSPRYIQENARTSMKNQWHIGLCHQSIYRLMHAHQCTTLAWHQSSKYIPLIEEHQRTPMTLTPSRYTPLIHAHQCTTNITN